MTDVKLEHFRRAIVDVREHGDNDTLPFDIDTRFIADAEEDIAKLAFRFSQEVEKGTKKGARNAIDALPIFAERLLVPTGASGFRITTKIHPFWNIYFNGLGIAIAERLEPKRSDRAHSYRFASHGVSLFDRDRSWRAFRVATVDDCQVVPDTAVVVQTDISNFYEHISHHRLENSIDDLFAEASTVPTQIDRFLSKFASGRSFGLPVGGQCSRMLAELLLTSIDQSLSDARIIWRRYVDDFVLIAANQAEAYRALSILSHALADYGLALNRTKTMLLTARHYIDYVRTQLGEPDDEANKLFQIDLRFDPYSDTPETDYVELKALVESLDIRTLLEGELHKGQPDTFLVTQIGRTLRLHSPEETLRLCETLLAPSNLHSFRASWSTIMRGISSVCADDQFSSIFDSLDKLLDDIPNHSPHLLLAEASCLHYLRSIRFRRTDDRAKYVFHVYSTSLCETVRRACLDCWRLWKDRRSFTRERNRWNALKTEEQRMLWYAAGEFGDEGDKFRQQVKQSLVNAWRLGIERANAPTFATVYCEWVANGPKTTSG
jgi:hypothetical protein